MIKLENRVTYQAAEKIGKKAIKRFAQAIGDHNILYRDEEYARKTRHGGLIAPPTLIFELGYDLGEEINEETGIQLGLERFLGYPKNIQRLGNEYEMLEIARPADRITANRTIIEAYEKRGKSGEWLFVTSQIIYTNQQGKVLGTNREKLACRY